MEGNWFKLGKIESEKFDLNDEKVKAFVDQFDQSLENIKYRKDQSYEHTKSYFSAGGRLGGGDLWFQPTYRKIEVLGKLEKKDVFINPDRIIENPMMRGGYGDNWRNLKEPFLKILKEIWKDESENKYKASMFVLNDPREDWKSKVFKTEILFRLDNFSEDQVSLNKLYNFYNENCFFFESNEAKLLKKIFTNQYLFENYKYNNRIEQFLGERYSDQKPFKLEFSYTEAREIYISLEKINEAHIFYNTASKYFGLDCFEIVEKAKRISELIDWYVKKDDPFWNQYMKQGDDRTLLTLEESMILIMFSGESIKIPINKLPIDLKEIWIEKYIDTKEILKFFGFSIAYNKFLENHKFEDQLVLEQLIRIFKLRLEGIWKTDKEIKEYGDDKPWNIWDDWMLKKKSQSLKSK